MRQFCIGDRVYSKQYELEGTVTDWMFSPKSDEWAYTVHFDGKTNPFTAPIFGRELEPVEAVKTYRWEVFQADNDVVTAVMYEIVNGVEREVDRKHGHVIHHGTIGFAQAASYAMKKIYIGMNDGKLIESEVDRYV